MLLSKELYVHSMVALLPEHIFAFSMVSDIC